MCYIKKLYIKFICSIGEVPWFEKKNKIIEAGYELFSEVPVDGLDYMIGSVHYLKFGDEILGFDRNLQQTLDYVNDNFGGDGLAFAKKYFETVITLPEKHNFDIIGHFDLLLKNSDYLGYKPTQRFLDCAEKAVKELCRYSAPFEINTGAMARGYRSVPYPIPEILAMIKKYGGKITFSSDCHDKKYLEYGYDVAEKLAIEAGFTEHGVITEKGVEYIPIV